VVAFERVTEGTTAVVRVRKARRALVACLSIPCLVLTVSARSLAANDAGCAVSPCNSDSDCDDRTRCVLGADAACAREGGAACGLCMIRWQASCETTNDCGPGFACMASQFTCDCSTDAGAPDVAVATPCADAEVPQDCEGGGECVAASPCDAGTCLCWPVNVCVEAQVACTVDAQCDGGANCIGGACVPTDWTCEGGSCEPPCFDVDVDGGALTFLPDAAATAVPDYAQSSGHGCALHAIGFGRACDVAWCLLGLVAVAGRRRLRRRR
jgi:hypothetical protein